MRKTTQTLQRLSGRLGVGAAVAGALVAAGATAGAANASSSTSLTLGLPVPDSTFVSAYIAEDKGLFKKEGLNVKLVTFQGGSDLTKAVVGGSVQVGINGLGGIIPAILQHQAVKVIYGGFNELSYKWYSLPGINTIKQAAGKTWSVTKVGSDTDYLTRYLLSRNGINPMNVQILGGGPSASRIAAMGQNQVQVSIDSNPGNLEMAAKGYHLLATESQFTKSYPDHLVFAKQDYISANSSVISKVLTALTQGMKLAKSNPKLAEAEMVKWDKIPAKYAAATYKGFIKDQFPDGRLPDAQSMNTFWQIGIKAGEFPKALPESQWLDKTWINSYPNFPQ